MQRRLLVLFILLTLSLSFHAQQIRDSVTVEVVDVPVFVSRGSTPVQGLRAEDFELYVNGQRQSIDYFDVVSPANEPSLRERRLFLIVFDAAFSRPHALVRAQTAASRLIASAPESDLFAVATFTSRAGVQFAAPFTSDRGALQRAIGSLTVSKSGDPLAIVVTPAERASIESFTNDGSADRADAYLASVREVDRMSAAFISEMAMVQIRRRARDQVEAFEELSQRLASLEGQKHVVVMTEGFDGDTSRASFISRMEPAPNRIHQPFADSFMYTSLLAMYRTFQQSDVLLHTIDLAGLEMMPAFDGAHYLLPAGTGGTAYTNRNDITGALADLSDQFAIGYRLGFRPQSVRAGHNSVWVKLRHSRGLSVRHRLGFSGTPQSADVDEGLYLADVVLNDVPQTGTAAALEVGKGVLHARIPMQPLAAQLGEAGVAELLVYVFDQHGKAIAYHERTIAVPSGATGESAFDIPLPSETKVVKALLRVDESIGFTKVTS